MTRHSVGQVEPGLAEFVAARARGASDRRLVADAVGGILVAVAMVVWRPSWGLPVLCGALCFAAFGCWGILDRELQEGEARRRELFRVLKGLAVVVGTLAAALLVLVVTAVAIGGFSH